MPLAARLKGYLDARGVVYDVVHHQRATTTRDCAHAAHVPCGRMAKAVLLEDATGYLVALLPASCRLELDHLRSQLGRSLRLAREPELADVFADCEPGALPALGAAYGLPTVIDDCLLRLPDLYFEGGDHEDLVHLSGLAFRALHAGCAHGRFSRPH